ncbi:MAG TPA: class I SAM-dependent methyltransferase [Anaerolineae bacterium]|nr:class I SAM-dependent methyltransferase [Anaerolineae bacterium]
MRSTRWIRLTGAAAGLAVAGACIYGQRPRERIPSPEGIEDPAIAAAFNRIARWPQMRLLRRAVIRRATAMMRAGEAVDLGCGPGYLVTELAQAAPGLHVTGIDLADEMIAAAERFAAAKGLGERVVFRKGDASRIPFPDDSLDLVVSTLSLHHWSDPRPVLDEVARVVRPGGVYLIFDLRRDLAPPSYLLIWFATHVVVPLALKQAGEPMGSRDAAYTPAEAEDLARRSRLTGWQVTSGPLWLTIEGRKP